MSDQSVASMLSVESLSPALCAIAPCFEAGSQPSLLEIEPQSSILRPDVLKRLKLAMLRGKDHITPSFTLENPTTTSQQHDHTYSVKQERSDEPTHNIRHRAAHAIDLCSNGFDEYRPTKRAKLGRMPQPATDILHDKELAAHWIARELVEFAQGYTIVDDEHSDDEDDDDSELDEQITDSSDESLPGDVPGLERPDSSDSVDSFTSTDADRLMNNIQASFSQEKSADAPSPVQRPIPISRHPLSLFSPTLSSLQNSSAFRSISTSFGNNSLSLYAGNPSTTFANSLSYTGNSPSLYPQWGTTSSAFTPLTSTCFTSNSLQLGKSSSGLYPQPNSGAFSVPAPPNMCPSTTAASVMVSLAFSSS